MFANLHRTNDATATATVQTHSRKLLLQPLSGKGRGCGCDQTHPRSSAGRTSAFPPPPFPNGSERGRSDDARRGSDDPPPTRFLRGAEARCHAAENSSSKGSRSLPAMPAQTQAKNRAGKLKRPKRSKQDDRRLPTLDDPAPTWRAIECARPIGVQYKQADWKVNEILGVLRWELRVLPAGSPTRNPGCESCNHAHVTRFNIICYADDGATRNSTWTSGR